MSSSLTVDVCPSSFLSYITSPAVETYAIIPYEPSVLPNCVSGLAPFRLQLSIYRMDAPYNGTVYIYVDDDLVATVDVTDGVVDTVILAAPGTHSVTVRTAQDTSITVLNVTFACA